MRKYVFLVLVFLASFTASAQNLCKGTVIDKDGNPVAQAKVEVVGTEISCLTDLDGVFRIEMPTNLNMLKVEYLGMSPKTVKTTSNMTIIMHKQQSIRPLQHLEVGVNAGTLGVGIDFSTPINNYLSLRGGYTFMPKFSLSMEFGVGIEENTTNTEMEPEDVGESKFDKMAAIVEGLTGSKVDDHVTMIGQPTMHNFKLLVDIHPFKNKHWHFTTGFYAGHSTIARVTNSAEDMPTLYAANMFNNMYDKALIDEPVISWNGMDLYAGEALLENGRLGFDIGNRADGSVYKIEPNEFCMVSVEARTNAFKPYLGFGYSGGKGKTHFNFDCGILFWGGAPDIITHDGTNLTHDITNIKGQIGEYIGLARQFTVYPALSIGISRIL